MSPSPRAVSYSFPAKYGGEVTTRATELSGSFMSRASPQTSGSGDSNRPATVSSTEICFGWNRA